MLKKVSLLTIAALVAPTVMAMPKQQFLQGYESWSVAKNLDDNEYWAYGELDNGYTLAFIASRDVVGPGCTLNKIALTSDVLLNPKPLNNRGITATFLVGDSSFGGQLIPSKKTWASMYSVVSVSASEVANSLYKADIGRAKTVSLVLESGGISIEDAGAMSGGMYNAYKHALDLCRLDRAANEIIDVNKASKTKFSK